MFPVFPTCDDTLVLIKLDQYATGEIMGSCVYWNGAYHENGCPGVYL